MAYVYQTDNPDNYYEFDALDVDEFLPLVKIEPEKVKDPFKKTFEIDGDELSNTQESVTLSEHLDSDKRTFTLQQLTTDKNKLKLRFKVIKGISFTSMFEQDDDGYIEPKLSIEDKNIKITSSTQLKKKYGDTLEVEIAINSKETTEFYLDFYANDNEDDFNVGEYINVHCGKLKIIKEKKCICRDKDWSFFSSLVSETKKVLYGSELSWTDKPECYHYALQQLRDLGYWVKNERWNKKWDGTKELNDDIFQLHLDSDVAGMKKGPQEKMFKNSLIYLKQAMKYKIPVMVGLDYHSGYANDDLITDHFAVITGCGKDSSSGKLFFYITDNAFENQKYYCDCKSFEIRSADGQNIISQIRKSKKI